MFHYRLAAPNNRSRMLIAVSLAIALHMGLMNFEFSPKPVFVPSVSLPRSVSVFLNQKKNIETSVLQKEKVETVEHIIKKQPAKKIEAQKTVSQKITPVKERTDIPVQQPVLMEKVVKKTAVEEITPATQKLNNIAEDIKPEPGKVAKIQESTTQVESQVVQQEEGVDLPGTLQMAYPRYQENAPPTYPALARKRGQEGTVILEVLVNREGRVNKLKIETSSGFRLLDRTALTAVQKWSFEPGRKGKEKVPMWVQVPVTFKLKQ